jgi:hypothetical protein
MTIYRLYVFLLDIAPPIWRRIELSSETSLAQLHKVLQAAMGWQGYHLHEFEIGGQRYGVPDTDYDLPGEVVKDSAIKLSSALPRKGASLLYSYDFGDNWAHSVVLEDIVPIEPDTKYPRVLDGARACPPEDSGGDPRQAETQGVPTDARVGRKELRPGKVLGESRQSHAETSPAEESQTQNRSDSVGQIAPGDNNVGSTPISVSGRKYDVLVPYEAYGIYRTGGHLRVEFILAGTASLLLLLFWSLVVSSAWVRIAADVYANQ